MIDRRKNVVDRRRKEPFVQGASMSTHSEREATREEAIQRDMEDMSGKAASISQLMEGSEERLDTMRRIITSLTTDEKEAAARLASAVALANILHTETVVSADINNVIIYTNSTADGLLGYTAEELVGKPLTHIVPERLREQHKIGFFRYLKTGRRHFSTWRDIPIIALHKDGSEINVAISFDDVLVLGERMIVGILRKLDETISNQVIEKVADKVIEKVAKKTRSGNDHDG
jgi:PAS domain S-box-containing protein